MDEFFFDDEDVIIPALKCLYEGAGYTAYKIRKFEEYSLYLENRNFLSTDHIITFNDNGHLLALKPDVTLSIVKNKRASCDTTEKLYYRESVYRFDKHAHEYQEISQVGLELIGRVTRGQELEILVLALQSLSVLSSHTVLSVSHMGFLTGVLHGMGLTETQTAGVLQTVGTKNMQETGKALADAGVADEKAAAFLATMTARDNEEMLRVSSGLVCDGETRAAYEDWRFIIDALTTLGYGDRVHADVSVTGEADYYNGVVFKGYAEGLSGAVLSGGRYDRLASRFTPGVGAIGFAVYLGELLYHQRPRKYDTDILIAASPDSDPIAVATRAQELRAEGNRVRVEQSVPRELRYRELLRM